MTEMTQAQTRAFDIYMESATMDNGYTPLSFKKIAEQLNAEGLDGSKSSVGRWAVKFKWKEMLEKSISASITDDEEVKDLIEASSINAANQKVIDDFLANERLKSSSYTILEAQMMKYSKKLSNGQYLSHNEEKFILKVLEITSTREDKLLDRQALLSATKLTNSEDVLKALNDETIDVEMEE